MPKPNRTVPTLRTALAEQWINRTAVCTSACIVLLGCRATHAQPRSALHRPVDPQAPLTFVLDSTTSEVPSRDAWAAMEVASDSTGVVRLAFDNPCELSPKGTFAQHADTVTIEVGGFERSATGCPAQYLPQWWHASLPPLAPGAYVLRVRIRFGDGVVRTVYTRSARL